MADLVLPDPRLEYPALYTPGVKPLRPVEIDKSNLYGRFCSQYFYVSDDLIDSNGIATVQDGTKAIGVDSDGTHLACDGSTNYVALDRFDVSDCVNSFTILLDGKTLGTIAGCCFFDQRSTTPNKTRLISFSFNSESAIRLAWTDGSSWSDQTLSFSSSTYTRYVVAISCKTIAGTSYADVTINGRYIGQLSSAVNFTDHVAAKAHLGKMVGETYPACRVYSAWLLNSAIDNNCSDLSRNPYQLLIPR